MDFTPEYVKEFSALLKDASDHFARKYPKTTIITYHDSLDEAGFQGPGWARRTKDTAMALLRTYQGYARIFKSLEVKNLLFKLDIGSGFSHCGFDLDGDGRMEGPKDVVDALPDVGLWAVNGGRIRLRPLESVMKKGVPVWFYNGGRRLGPKDIAQEGLGPRTWPWVAWNSSGITGMMIYSCDVGYYDKPWEKGGGSFLYFYPGKDVGAPGKVFVSMRLKAFRRGLQDYEYLYLLAKKDGKKDRAMDYSLRVVQNAISRRLDIDKNNQVDDQENDDKDLVNSSEKDTRHWSHNPEDFERSRYRIGEILGSK